MKISKLSLSLLTLTLAIFGALLTVSAAYTSDIKSAPQEQTDKMTGDKTAGDKMAARQPMRKKHVM
ncbi:MAG: hypothetical protein ABJB34_06610, partial [Acidobacteriota bacterium]